MINEVLVPRGEIAVAQNQFQRALIHLRREVKFMEQQQIKRLNAAPTNAVVAVTTEPK